jgi:hypothetical protein
LPVSALERKKELREKLAFPWWSGARSSRQLGISLSQLGRELTEVAMTSIC